MKDLQVIQQRSKEKSRRGASSILAKEISMDKMRPDVSGQ